MKSLIVLLALLGLTMAHHVYHHERYARHAERQQSQTNELPSILEGSGSCDDPDTLVDKLLESSRQYKDSDISDLDDIEVRFRYPGPSPRHPGVRGKITLSKGQLTGIIEQAQRQGKSESEKLEEGNKCTIHARLQHRRLQVEYGDIDIKTEPDQGVDADSYRGYLYNVKAYLGLEYDEDEDDLDLKYYVMQESDKAEFTLKGAEEKRRQNPMIEKEVLHKLQKEVGRKIEKQMKDIIKKYGEDSAY